ncbi:MAG: uncharacterized protein PWQ77_960 [Kosmotogales bacterium]|nr:uncharacterized protein [Kosmotogales bacterium]
MKLKILDGFYSVCKLSFNSPVPIWASEGKFYSITKTDEELSIVCESLYIPEGVEKEDNWKIIEIVGPLDFSQIGIIHKISSVFKDVGMSIFVISTFNTDYLMFKANFEKIIVEVLKKNKYEFV